MSMRWKNIRKANIEQTDRDLFERIGELTIRIVLTSGFQPATEELQSIYNNPDKKQKAQEWLTEKADIHERREDRLETVEWAILIFVVVGVLVDVLLLFRN